MDETTRAVFFRKYPVPHYVSVDHKLQNLAAMKQNWTDSLTVAWVVQGHYAHDPKATSGYPAPDIRLERIADLERVGSPDLLGGSIAGRHAL